MSTVVFPKQMMEPLTMMKTDFWNDAVREFLAIGHGEMEVCGFKLVKSEVVPDDMVAVVCKDGSVHTYSVRALGCLSIWDEKNETHRRMKI